MLAQSISSSPNNMRLTWFLNSRWCLCLIVLNWLSWLRRPWKVAVALLICYLKSYPLSIIWSVWWLSDQLAHAELSEVIGSKLEIQIGCLYTNYKNSQMSCEAVPRSRDTWLWIAIFKDAAGIADFNRSLTYRPNYQHLMSALYTFFQVLSVKIPFNLGEVGRTQTGLVLFFFHNPAYHSNLHHLNRAILSQTWM